MKNFNLWFILALIAIFAMTCASQWNLTHRNTAHSHTLHTAPTEHDTVKLADILLYTDRDGVMHFDTNKTKYLHGFTGDSIIHYYGYLFKIGKHNEWKLKHTIYKEREAFGNYTTYIYEAYHKGYPIDKNVFYFDVKNGQIFRGKEISIVNDLDVDTSITLTSDEAKKKALNDVNQKIWQVRMNKKLIEKDTNYELVYAVVVWTLSPYDQYEILIDANSGDVLDNYSLHKNCGTGHLIPNLCSTPVTQNVNMDILYYQQPGQPTLPPISSSSSKSNTVTTCGSDKVFFDIGNGIKLANTVLGNPSQFYGWNSTQDCAANTFYWVAKNTKNYFNNKGVNIPFLYLNMMGYTNNSSSGTAAPTAGFPAGYTINIGLGSTSTGTKPLFTYDIVGHEFMHIVDKHTVNIAASNSYAFEERFILFEGMCDVMGITIESKYKQNDWVIGDDVNFPEKRNLQNPHLSNSINGYDVNNFISTFGSQPKIYNEPSKWINPATLPSGTLMLPSGSTLNLDKYSRSAYAHHNNGVFNYWFYLLAEGNSNAVGIDVASNIAFLAWKDEFISYGDKNFHTFRDATLKIAFEKYDCNTWQTVRQAWDAVGVTGSACEMAVNITTNCPSPSTCSANITTCGVMNNPQVIVRDLTTNTNVYNNKPNGLLTLSNLVCGRTYKVTVRDKTNPACEDVIKTFTCQSNAMGSINPPCPPSSILTASYNVINNCNDNNIIGSVTGGIPPYTYNWSNGSTSQNLMNVPSGTYNLTVSDAGCNNSQNTFSVNGLTPLNVSGQVTYASCNSTPPPPHHPPTNNNGASINLIVTGGLAPYTYNWSTGGLSQSLTNLLPNSYTVTVTDANNCSKVTSFTIGVPEPNLINVSVLQACPIANDGEIINITTGGTPPYSYQWSGPNNSQTVESPTGLKTGTHYVTVTDANGCTDITTRFVPPAIYTYFDDLANCERIYTCHGNSYSENKVDYNNINRDFQNCEGTAPCLLAGGANQIIQGQVLSYQIDGGFLGKNPHCEQTCKIHGQIGYAAAPDGITFTIVDGTCDGVTIGNQIMGGINYQVWCDGVYYGDFCDDADIIISIGIDPELPPLPPLPPGARVQNPDNITTYPNPFNEYLNLKFDGISDEVTIKLTNILGQEIEQHVYNINEGENIIAIKFNENLTNGVYLIQLEFSDGTVMTKKLIHQH